MKHAIPNAYPGALARIGVLLAVLLLTGCEAVLTEQPMGAAVVKLDAATWEGTWLGSEIVMVTTILDADQGLLEAAWVERAQEGARFEAVRGTVRRTGEWLFLNMESQQFGEDEAASPSGGDVAAEPDQSATDAPPAEYLWGRVTNDGQQVLFWWPDVEQIRQAVRDGRLPGTVREDKDVLLGTLDEAGMELINTPGSSLLRWSEPVVLTRLAM